MKLSSYSWGIVGATAFAAWGLWALKKRWDTPKIENVEKVKQPIGNTAIQHKPLSTKPDRTTPIADLQPSQKIPKELQHDTATEGEFTTQNSKKPQQQPKTDPKKATVASKKTEKTETTTKKQEKPETKPTTTTTTSKKSETKKESKKENEKNETKNQSKNQSKNESKNETKKQNNNNNQQNQQKNQKSKDSEEKQ